MVVNDVGAALTGRGMTDARPAGGARNRGGARAGAAVASADSVAEWASAQRIVKAAIDRYGRIDIVVNNAGILRDTIFHRMTPEEFDAVIKVHLYGAFYVRARRPRNARPGERCLRAHDLDLGADRQHRPGELCGGETGHRRAVAGDRRRCRALQGALQLHRPARLQPHDRKRAGGERGADAGAGGEDAPDQVAQLAAFLACDAAAEVTGQIMGARGNEIYLYSQPRPIRTLHRGEGWTPARMAEHLLPAIRSSLTPLERTRECITGKRSDDASVRGRSRHRHHHVLAGPFAAYQLAVLGADVIKLEHPDYPDQSP